MDQGSPVPPPVAWTNALDRFHQRHPWSHNAHFHPWVLRRLPSNPHRALDVGCGTGDLMAALRDRCAHVTGIDPDSGMARVAGARFAADPAVTVRRQRFDDLPDDEDGAYDVVTMVASLHHLPIEPTLRRIRRLLAPGGRLLVVGLAETVTGMDYAWAGLTVPIDLVVALAKHPRAIDPDEAADEPGAEPPMPVRDPTVSYDQVAEIAELVLGKVRFRRRLFYRYTLEWTRPTDG